jgi:hypothetical protein
VTLIEVGKDLPAISDMPVWRRIVLYLTLGFFLLVTVLLIGDDSTIYESAPDHPVPTAGQMYAVKVMHGHVRYVTASERDSNLAISDGRIVSWAGAAMLVAFFVLVTSRKKTSNRVR